jgi:flagellar biosynthesis/type III secretory pathway M-ring protein FliF/YscJ
MKVKNLKEAAVRMKPLKKYLLIFLVAAFAVSTNACKRNEQGEGAAEQAGEKIDKALERAGEETGRLLERAGEKMQEYGEKEKDAPPAKPAPAAP